MKITRKMSMSEQHARRLAKELGAKMRRDNERRTLIVTIGEQRQEFWLNSWPDVLIWLRNEEKRRLRG